MEEHHKRLHVASRPRLYPSRLPVENLGYIRAKEDWVDTVFSSFNFSFILHGVGEYRINNTVYNVSAPCVITQWPGVRVTYGANGAWEELFLIYSSSCMEELERCGFADFSRPIWYASETEFMREGLEAIRKLIAGTSVPAGSADRIDRICEHMIIESLLRRAKSFSKTETSLIESIRQRIEKTYNHALDIESLAGECSMSVPTFRRYWSQVVGMPPTVYVRHLRIQEASRLLAESDMEISLISQRVGYRDPLYFSRLFKKETGMSPTAYRVRYKEPWDVIKQRTVRST